MRFKVVDENELNEKFRNDALRNQHHQKHGKDKKYDYDDICKATIECVNDGCNETSNALLVDWSKPHRHNSPRLWQKDDFEEILFKSEKCCYARKFIGDIDLDIVKMIERKYS